MPKLSDLFTNLLKKGKKSEKEKNKNTDIAPALNSADVVPAARSQNKKSETPDKTADPPVRSKIYTYEHGIDRPMLIIILLLSMFGLIMVYSSSYVYALTYYGNSAYYAIRQALFLALGIAVMIGISRFGYKLLEFTPIPAFAFALVLLIAVLVFGVNEGEARRWIFIGPVSFQPSEFMKIAMVLMIAWVSSKFRSIVHSRKKFWKSTLYGFVIPVMIIGISCLLVLLEKHLSGTIILFLIGFALLWANGSPAVWTVSITAIGVAAVAFVIFAVTKDPEAVKEAVPDYMFVRVDSWLHPENYSELNELWQTIQGKIAVGSGGFFGRGFGQSLQKHLFVSMPQNDFIFAIVCEELGFIGAISVIGLYIAFVARGIYIAKNSPDVFCSITAIGISAHVGFQALLNMAVVIGLIPNTGISLPFFSAGGSSLIFLFIEAGILLLISKYTPVYESKEKKRMRAVKSEK